jgi:hypothetical protein
VVEDVLDRQVGSTVFSARDADGHDYLVLEQTAATRRDWVCAPISPLALRCVRSGRADIRDAFRHTTTGYVLVLSADRTGDVVTSIELCNGLSEDLLPSRHDRPARVA